MVVAKVPVGNIYIVSDSEINVAMFYKARSIALGSTNGDLWRTLFGHLDSKPISLKLYWVPGHLDTDTSKAKGHVPDVHFALNHCADHFAGLAVKMIDHPMHIASGVLRHSALVQKTKKDDACDHFLCRKT